MGQKNIQFKIWTWVLSILLFFSILLTASAIYLNYHWKPILSERIKQAINSSTNGLYNIDFENIRINIINGRISVKNIKLIPDTLVFNTMRSDTLAPRHLYKVKINKLTLNQVHPFKIYFKGILEMTSVIIDKPILEVSFNDKKSEPDTVTTDLRTTWQRLSPYLNSLKIQNITFRNADFTYIDHSVPGSKITNLKGLTIRVSDLLIDSASQYDKTRLYHTKDIYAELNEYRSVTADSNYAVQIRQLTASTSQGYARVKGFSLVPRFGEMEFSTRVEVQKERYSVNVEELQLNNINYKMLNTQRRLIASKLSVRKGNVSIFLNRAIPDSLRDRRLSFPQRLLKRFNLRTRVDTVLIRDSRVNYSEYNPDSRRKGTVVFSKMDGSVLNVTNDSLSLSRNDKAEARLTALLMDRGRLNISMKFRLAAPGNDFEFKGNVGRMDASMFNPAIRPLSLIEIRSGFLNKMDFNGSGSTKGVKGSVACYYKDLKIALLEQSEQTTWLKRRGIASIFANVLIIESENPSPGKPVRKVDFDYIRPEHSSFFNMIWKGLSSALLGSIGFDEETQKEIKVRLRKMEIERFNREERRDDRLKRKVQRRFNRNDKRQ
ncbi:MAG: hypothetical protein ACYCZO_10665 [Daejeonella sp.]